MIRVQSGFLVLLGDCCRCCCCCCLRESAVQDGFRRVLCFLFPCWRWGIQERLMGLGEGLGALVMVMVMVMVLLGLEGCYTAEQWDVVLGAG